MSPEPRTIPASLDLSQMKRTVSLTVAVLLTLHSSIATASDEDWKFLFLEFPSPAVCALRKDNIGGETIVLVSPSPVDLFIVIDTQNGSNQSSLRGLNGVGPISIWSAKDSIGWKLEPFAVNKANDRAVTQFPKIDGVSLGLFILEELFDGPSITIRADEKIFSWSTRGAHSELQRYLVCIDEVTRN